jgi:hypothetical protein
VQGTPGISAYPITLTVVGTQAKLNTFLDQLQRTLPRAVLVNSVNAVPTDGDKSLDGKVSMTVTMNAFAATNATPTG